MNLERRFHGRAKYREGSKCTYFKWVDAKFSSQAREVILELLERWNEPPPTIMGKLEDIDSMQAQMNTLKFLANHLKKEVSRMKIERKYFRALVVFLFTSVAYFVVKCKVSDENQYLRLP